MNRSNLQALASDRVDEASALLSAGHPSGAYYLIGYAVECGLKACVLAHVERTGAIFEDRKFSEKCWTHSFAELVVLAGLKPTLDRDCGLNQSLNDNWTYANYWTEASRYERWTAAEAQALIDSITEPTDGVLTWITSHW